MAKKKKIEEQNMQPMMDETQFDQMQQIDGMQQQLQEIDRLNAKTAQVKQDIHNTQHDTEMSPFSEGNGQATPITVIGEEEVNKAYQILLKYRDKKKKLEQKIADNEEFWKLNHWNVLENGKEDDKRIKPKSGWLFNTIINKHADGMDNYPEANILPRTLDDEKTAEILAKCIPVILEQNDFEQTYSDVLWYKCKNGTGVTGVFWDNDKQNGLGDISIKKIDLMNIYWKDGITDIQDSPNVFLVEMVDNEELAQTYPNINTGTNLLPLSTYGSYADDVTTAEQTPVVDWYYKKRVATTDDDGIPHIKTYLHYCKFCNGQVIYASENDPNFAERGWYDHGKYPFVFDVLFPVERSVCGMGYIDVIKDDQLYIDKLQQAILENAVANARPRYAVRRDSGLNEDEFMDLSKPVVHFDGNLGEDAFRQIVPTPLSSIYETVYQYKIEEMKDTSGNTAASQGQVSSVTAASGIASLQEAAGKLSRDANITSYRAFKTVVYLVIELIRQFYDEPRTFRIATDEGTYSYEQLDNSGLMPQNQGQAFGVDLGTRLPIMDIECKPQKKGAFTKEAQNQTALSMYAQGFFTPSNSDAALACLDMMNFDDIEKVRQNIGRNGTLYDQLMQMQQQMVQMAQIIDAQNGSQLTNEIVGGMQNNAMANQPQGNKTTDAKAENKGSLSTQAASAARNSTAPR